MKIISKEDLELLNNKRILSMSRLDWGKTISISNQYIQKNILEHLVKSSNFSVYSTDDTNCPVKEKNNNPGYDLLICSPYGTNYKIQSKLRQVKGLYDYSQQIRFETTRRNSNKNQNKNHTGHICYSIDEFDFVMISLVNDKNNRNNRNNCNLWSYCFIPVKELIDDKNDCCVSKINSNIIKKHIIDFKQPTILDYFQK